MSKAVTDQRAAARKNGRNASVSRGVAAWFLALNVGDMYIPPVDAILKKARLSASVSRVFPFT
jgi:hypothetical protein